MDKLSYAFGLSVGHQLKEWGFRDNLIVNDFSAAIEDVLMGREPQMGNETANSLVQTFFTYQEELRQAEAEKKGAAAKAEGEAFLGKNKLRPEVTTTASGLQYEVLQEGSGRQPKASDTVRCHYEGRLPDGTVFDSSYRRGVPADFGLRQVISGWTEGVQLMKEGAKYRFYIPWNLAYGERGAGADIPPYAALVFDVELVKVL
ncbi:MAG: FKBP-type peptidyl-prolyl cis-trans isomerase [Bacteroidales bacterium]|nr:FKBP-type peptidyl-prolyl cis-trans isomerase [Bacteroidales bacterium]